nr:putative mitochondrial protein [Tanacetum cinerariifolium]
MSSNKQNTIERQGKQLEFSSMQLCVFPYAKVSLIRMEGIPVKLQPELKNVVVEFADVFVVLKELPPSRPCDHRIPLLEGTNPINIIPYRHPPTQKEAIGSCVLSWTASCQALRFAYLKTICCVLLRTNSDKLKTALRFVYACVLPQKCCDLILHFAIADLAFF